MVGRILNLREEGNILCTQMVVACERCLSLGEIGLDEGSIFPAAELPDNSDSFEVTAKATVGKIDRTVVAVIDRSELSDPRLLFWRMR